MAPGSGGIANINTRENYHQDPVGSRNPPTTLTRPARLFIKVINTTDIVGSFIWFALLRIVIEIIYGRGGFRASVRTDVCVGKQQTLTVTKAAS